VTATLRRLLKRARLLQPFNWLATTSARAGLRLVGPPPEAVVRHLHRAGPVSSRLPNGRTLRLWSQADDWVSNQVFWRRWDGYEPETSPIFYCLARRSAVTVDVGAYVGFYTLLAAHANPAGHVLALEPLPSAFGRLVSNVRRNRLENVEAVECAVSSEEGIAAFHFQDTSVTQDMPAIPCSSSLSLKFMAAAAGLISAPVRVARLERLLDERRTPPVGLMKIDTETTEPDVLVGMGRRLHSDRPDIVCEVLAGHATGPRLVSTLAVAGYHYYHLTPGGPQLRQEIDGHPVHLNYLFSTRGPDEIQAVWLEALEIAQSARKDMP